MVDTTLVDISLTEPSSKQPSCRYDLHAHSHFSDGSLSPEQLVARAHEYGVTTLALTDHDTVAGVVAAQAAAKSISASIGDDHQKSPISVIPGIEFSCLWRKRLIHILGLNVDIHSPELLEATQHQHAIRLNRADGIAAKLSKLGIQGSLEGASYYAQEGVITRPHFAQYLIDAGHVSTFAQAFKRYLGDGGPADVKVAWPSLESVCEWITQAGGLAAVAHPDKYKLTRTKLLELLVDFKAAGGVALEVVSGQQEKSVTQQLAKIAADKGLFASCGSDFHRPENSWQILGRSSILPEHCQPIWELW